VGAATTEVSATAATEVSATAAADVSTATSAEMATTPATATSGTLREARRRQRENQCHGRSRAQHFQTFHDQTPFPGSKPHERAVVPGITAVCVRGQAFMATLYPA
jgi:hypothetical protein